MSEAEKTPQDAILDAFFADDGLPAHDRAFTHAVMARAARKRLRADLAGLAVLCGLAALVLWSLAPGLQRLGAWAAGLVEAAGPVLGVLALIATVLWFTTPQAARRGPVST